MNQQDTKQLREDNWREAINLISKKYKLIEIDKKLLETIFNQALEKQKNDFIYTPFFKTVASGVEMSNICDRRIKEALSTQRKQILEEVEKLEYQHASPHDKLHRGDYLEKVIRLDDVIKLLKE